MKIVVDQNLYHSYQKKPSCKRLKKPSHRPAYTICWRRLLSQRLASELMISQISCSKTRGGCLFNSSSSSSHKLKLKLHIHSCNNNNRRIIRSTNHCNNSSLINHSLFNSSIFMLKADNHHNKWTKTTCWSFEAKATVNLPSQRNNSSSVYGKIVAVIIVSIIM